MHFSVALLAVMATFESLSFAAPAPEAVAGNTETLAETEAHALVKRINCYGPPKTALRNTCTECANKLKSLGTQACVVSSGSKTNMCTSGDCHVRGIAVGKSSTSSYCYDVGTAVQAVIDTCHSAQSTGGESFASGNGNFEIFVGSSSV